MAATLFPRTVEEFLDELERRFPEPRYEPGMTNDQVMFEAGRRSVVTLMRDAHKHATRKDRA